MSNLKIYQERKNHAKNSKRHSSDNHAKRDSTNSCARKSRNTRNLLRKIAQNFLDILILKKLNGKQMRLRELCKALKKEAFISIDPRKLHKRIKSMEKEEIIKICSIDGRKLYSLTDKGKKMIEIIQKQHCQINEIIQNVIS